MFDVSVIEELNNFSLEINTSIVFSQKAISGTSRFAKQKQKQKI